MTKYAVEWKPAALRILKKLEPKIQKQILQDVVSLADDPRPHGCRKLAGHHDEWRIRNGTYRIVYTIEDTRLTITVVEVGHRREVYRA